MSEREEIVKCVHACMCAVLPATGERVKSKCWYCVFPVCLLGLLACETDKRRLLVDLFDGGARDEVMLLCFDIFVHRHRGKG